MKEEANQGLLVVIPASTPIRCSKARLNCPRVGFSFLNFPGRGGDAVITGQQLRDARSRAGWTQRELASRVNVTLRTVGNWENARVPSHREGSLRAVLGRHLGDAVGNPLAGFSDGVLLAEVGRRMARGRQDDEQFAEANNA